MPEVARRYYEEADALRGLLDDEQGAAGGSRKRRPRMCSLYDVFVRVRDHTCAVPPYNLRV